MEEAEKEKSVPMKTVTVDEWVHLNGQAPLWTRYAFFLEFSLVQLLTPGLVIQRKLLQRNTKTSTRQLSKNTLILLRGITSKATLVVSTSEL